MVYMNDIQSHIDMYNDEYDALMSRLVDADQNGGGHNFCKLPKSAKIFFGSGGSEAIIALTSDRAYKYFPISINSFDNNSTIKRTQSEVRYEIRAIKELTKILVDTDRSPHIIQYYAEHKCKKAPYDIIKDCKSFKDHLMSKRHDKKCEMLVYRRAPRQLIAPMHVLEMEKADGSLGGEMEKVSKKRWSDIEMFADILLFQTLYTLEAIKTKYPDYQHNDLFIRNILTIDKGYHKGQYIRYHYNNKIYDVPAHILYVKLNDFGLNHFSKGFSKKNNLIINHKVALSPHKDIFCLLYDIYNGNGIGGSSFTKLINNKDKLKSLDKYFNRFMNVKALKKIIKNSKKRFVDWNWNITLDRAVCKLFKIKTNKQYISGFSGVFKADDGHDVVEEYEI